MNDAYGTVRAPATLTISRPLPGPIERVWAWLTDGALRRQWLAEGDMVLEVGAEFELVWRNNGLTDPPGARPEGMTGEHRMRSRIVEVEAPHRLVFTWDESGEVEMNLAPQGAGVLLTVVHHRLPRHSMLLGVSAGWHGHLDLLAARLEGAVPEPFWDAWVRLRAEYAQRLPG
jgi:uncharacterized protein YndB with AHSA1/START domain